METQPETDTENMILELLNQDGFSPKKKGAAEYASPCPACGGDDRFVTFVTADRYWCRQCDVSGDAIQYLRDFHNMSFRDAAEAVSDESGIPAATLRDWKYPRRNGVAKTRHTNGKSPAQHWNDLGRKRIRQMSKWAHKQLLDNTASLEWLRTERGITGDSVNRFRLGWINRNYYLDRQQAGLDDTGKKLFIPSGLLIPWSDTRVRIRRDNPGEYGRYYVVPGSKSDPCIIGNFHENTAVVLESELDAILLAQESTRPLFIVALGSAQKKPDDGLLEMLNLCPVVLIALDNDEAGAISSRWWLKNLGNSYRTLTPREIGKDLSDAYMNGLDLNDWLSVSVELYCEFICESNNAVS